MTLLAVLIAASLSVVKPDTLVLDSEASVVKWKGTKFFGLGKHEGIVRLSDGYVALAGERIIGARFVVDMRSIDVTDIPPDDPVPRNRLRNHLMDEDFFAVARYPTSIFMLRSAVPQGEDAGFRLTGDLTMRGVTRPITVDVEVHPAADGLVRATSRFRINRHNWGVSFRGSRLTNDLVDDDLHFTLEFVLRPRRPQ
ncbi:MAG: YceI family protein [Gemmatimonadaceae bacterium]